MQVQETNNVSSWADSNRPAAGTDIRGFKPAPDLKYEYWMATLYAIDSGRRLEFCRALGGAESIWNINPSELERAYPFTEKELKKLTESRKTYRMNEEWETFQKKGIRFLPYFSAEYPKRLFHFAQPPYALFVIGQPPDAGGKSAAVVGARKCSEYGRTIAKKLGEELAGCGVSVISGMAAGIDSASHAGALSASGKTFAVLGCGCDICYPSSSRQIYRNIPLSGGAILSEFPPGTAPLPLFFPMRNRIISGLADLVIVVEAREKSGSLITADFALEQGKDIWAVPGRLGEPLSAGCCRLIEQGAGILWDIPRFLKTAGFLEEPSGKTKKTGKNRLEKEEALVYSCLSLHPKFLNTLLEETGLPLPALLAALDGLTCKKLIQETYQNYFSRTL